MKTGGFREDLWFRLNVFPIKIPPLRERKADIPALVRHFMQRKSKDLGLPFSPSLAPGAIDLLTSYDWPGNVRELENIIERALILSGGQPLTFGRLLEKGKSGEHDRSSSEGRRSSSLNEAMADRIREALEEAGGRVHGPGGAAEMLGVKPTTLRSKMDKLGIPYGRRH